MICFTGCSKGQEIYPKYDIDIKLCKTSLDFCYTIDIAAKPLCMSYAYSEEQFGSYTKLLVLHEESGNEIGIVPEMGARLNRFLVNLHGETVPAVDGYKTPLELGKQASAKSSLLAPFPNRVADGKFTYRNESYQLEINKKKEHNAIHGFISDQVFTVVSADVVEDFYEIVLEYVSEGAKGYPFAFKTTVTYRFGGVWLSVDTAVTNLEKTSIPIGFGWHPYFQLTVPIDEVQLTLPPVERIDVDARLIPTGVTEVYEKFQQPTYIGETEFDTGFHFLSDQREIQLYDDSHGMYLTIWMEGEGNNYEYVQLYTPPGRKSIAIEPMTCAADAFNNGMGLKKLAAHDTFKAQFTIMVS